MTDRVKRWAAPEVSIVVPGRDTADSLPLLLRALSRQTLGRHRFEVIYVDDASTDDSVAIAAASQLVKVVENSSHIGGARARNRGIEASSGQVVAFVDADTVPDDTWAEYGLQRCDTGDAELVAGKIDMLVGQDPTIAALVDASSYLNQELYATHGFAASANLWVRRSVIETIGGFNESLPYIYGEDEEFCWRAMEAGAKIAFAPEVRLTHPPRARLRDLTRKSFLLGRSYAARRRISTGTLSGARPVYLDARAYVPPRRLRGLRRLATLDYEPTMVELLKVYLVRYLCVQLASILGDFVGEYLSKSSKPLGRLPRVAPLRDKRMRG